MSKNTQTALSLRELKAAVAGRACAFRTRAILQPAGGPGTKVFPPTYAGAVYATEKRRIPGRDELVECVLLDSVQSQANRMEEALQQAVDDERLRLPMVEVDFGPFVGDCQPPEMRLLDPVGKISALQAPHRIADAILRDSLTKDGKPFRDSEEGRKISRVSYRDATPLFELCPTALLLGMWDSTGPKGGLGAKFERAMVSEIVGIDAAYGVKTSSRIDPAIRKNPPLYETAEGEWTALESEAVMDGKKPKAYAKKLSKLNFGNVTPDFSRYSSDSITKDNRETLDIMRQDGSYIQGGRIAPGGVTITSAEQTIVLSLPALRRLRFPVDEKCTAERDNAARTVLVALGLCAAALADERGLDLRSRCLLYPQGELNWELLDRRGDSQFELSADAAIELFHKAVDEAKAVGLPWREEPLVLTPSPELVKLVVKSQELTARQGGQGGE